MDMAAASLVEFIQVPATSLVEDFGDKRLVLMESRAEEELMMLLFHYYPVPVSAARLHQDMDRRASSTVSNVITALYKWRLIEGNKDKGYKSTA